MRAAVEVSISVDPTDPSPLLTVIASERPIVGALLPEQRWNGGKPPKKLVNSWHRSTF